MFVRRLQPPSTTTVWPRIMSASGEQRKVAAAVMSRIHAPVAAYFGENDLGLTPRIAPATADMKRLGKEFTVEVYKEATHVFLYRQDLGRNQAATEDSWPKAMAFFKKHLMTATPTR